MVKTILIIDDDQDFAKACKNLLDSAGYSAEFETREQSAIDRINKIKPDLILLDVVMSNETSGFSIAGKISADPGLKNIPVFFLTGYFKEDTMREQESDIFSRFPCVKAIIDKPVKPGILIEHIKKNSIPIR